MEQKLTCWSCHHIGLTPVHEIESHLRANTLRCGKHHQERVPFATPDDCGDFCREPGADEQVAREEGVIA